jgi:hypothetical protein
MNYNTDWLLGQIDRGFDDGLFFSANEGDPLAKYIISELTDVLENIDTPDRLVRSAIRMLETAGESIGTLLQVLYKMQAEPE